MNEVFLFDSISWMSEKIAKFAIICHKNKALTSTIETSDSEQSLICRYKVNYSWAA